MGLLPPRSRGAPAQVLPGCRPTPFMKDEDRLTRWMRGEGGAASLIASDHPLLRVKHTAELLTLAPKETARALEEIEESDALARFHAAAESLGLQRHRYTSITTTSQLHQTIRMVEWALRRFAWNTRRLAATCRWIRRSVRRLQDFARRHVGEAQRRKRLVLEHWKNALTAARGRLSQQTHANVKRYRLSPALMVEQHALDMLADCHVDESWLWLAVNSLWTHRKVVFQQQFRAAQERCRRGTLTRLDSWIDLAQNRAPWDPTPVPAPQLLERRVSIQVAQTVTFRMQQLRRIRLAKAALPTLTFDVASVGMDELYAMLLVLKQRRLLSSMDAYTKRFASVGESADHLPGPPATTPASPGPPPLKELRHPSAAAVGVMLGSEGGNDTALHDAIRLEPDEAFHMQRLLSMCREKRVPVSYAHALLTVDPRSQWWLLWWLQWMHTGPVTPELLGSPPEGVVASQREAQRIVSEIWLVAAPSLFMVLQSHGVSSRSTGGVGGGARRAIGKNRGVDAAGKPLSRYRGQKQASYSDSSSKPTRSAPAGAPSIEDAAQAAMNTEPGSYTEPASDTAPSYEATCTQASIAAPPPKAGGEGVSAPLTPQPQKPEETSSDRRKSALVRVHLRSHADVVESAWHTKSTAKMPSAPGAAEKPPPTVIRTTELSQAPPQDRPSSESVTRTPRRPMSARCRSDRIETEDSRHRRASALADDPASQLELRLAYKPPTPTPHQEEAAMLRRWMNGWMSPAPPPPHNVAERSRKNTWTAPRLHRWDTAQDDAAHLSQPPPRSYPSVRAAPSKGSPQELSLEGCLASRRVIPASTANTTAPSAHAHSSASKGSVAAASARRRLSTS